MSTLSPDFPENAIPNNPSTDLVQNMGHVGSLTRTVRILWPFSLPDFIEREVFRRFSKWNFHILHFRVRAVVRVLIEKFFGCVKSEQFSRMKISAAGFKYGLKEY